LITPTRRQKASARKSSKRSWALAALISGTIGSLLLVPFFIWKSRLGVVPGLYPPMGQGWHSILICAQVAFLPTGPITLTIGLIAAIRRRGGGPWYFWVPSLLIGIVLCFYALIIGTGPPFA
jgi:hypothetical protein